MRVGNFPIFTAGNMSTTLTSAPFSVYQVFGWSAQFVFTGSPTGSLTVNVSNDPYSTAGGGVTPPSNWSLLASSTEAISSAGNLIYNVDLAFYNWVQFVYTPSGGTGSLSGRMNTKGN